jgi:hypothetical protein
VAQPIYDAYDLRRLYVWGSDRRQIAARTIRRYLANRETGALMKRVLLIVSLIALMGAIIEVAVGIDMNV